MVQQGVSFLLPLLSSVWGQQANMSSNHCAGDIHLHLFFIKPRFYRFVYIRDLDEESPVTTLSTQSELLLVSRRKYLKAWAVDKCLQNGSQPQSPPRLIAALGYPGGGSSSDLYWILSSCSWPGDC